MACVRWALLILALLQTGTAHADFTFEHPSELHRALAAAKAERMLAGRQAAGVGASSLEQLKYDVTYYDLDLQLIVPTAQVIGRVLMQARSLVDGLVQFDVDLYFAMTVDSVFSGGQAAIYSHIGSELYIRLPQPLQAGDPFDALIYYRGNPAAGGFGAFGFNTHGSPPTPIIWSLSEPYYARNWWPCKDTPSDKADSLDIRITCPDELFAASNGLLAEVRDNGNGTKTYHWRHRYPITTYLVSVAVTNYTRLDHFFVYNGGADTMPVHFWVYPEKAASAQASYPEVVQMIGALEPYFGPYPFRSEKYAISHFPWGGGMEHQTNSSQSSNWYSWALNVHELAHQWWGNWVTCKTWSDIWLNEGFASWSEALYREWLAGPEAYRSYMNAMAYRGGGTIYVYDTANVNKIFHGGLSYDKAAWVVHMLRHVLGDDTFFAALAEYRTRYAGSSATTDDFRTVCEQVSGRNLEPFFSDWIHGTYFPLYLSSFYSRPAGSDWAVRVLVEQIQTTSPLVFDMPLDLRFSDGVREATRVVHNSERLQWFDLLLPFDPNSLVLDPHDWVLKLAFSGVAIVSDTLKPGVRDEAYQDTLRAVRGVPPYRWSRAEGAQYPPGLVLSSTGVLSGIAGAQGTFVFTAQVTDAGVPQSRMERPITVLIGPPRRPAGDVTNDGRVTSSDIIYLVNYVFKGGPPPVPAFYGDVDLSCTINAADIIYLVNFVFRAGPPPFEGCAP